MRVLAVSVLVFMAALLTALPAEATAPGDNGRIAFRRFVAPDAVATIFTTRPDGTGERQLAQPPEGAADDHPDYAADGSLIAFDRCGEVGCQIMVARPDGSGLRQITPDPVCTEGPGGTECADNGYPALSPDGRHIAFSHDFGNVVDDQIDHVGIYTSRLRGDGLRQVTLPPTRTAEDNEPQWSPDGRRLVFVRVFLDGHNQFVKQAIYTVKADGSGLRRLTPFSLAAGDGPDWSPDGSKILFRSPENEDFLHSQLYTVRPDGRHLKQVTHVPDGTHLYSASFSPDGRRITLGLEGTGGAADVYTMRTDGSDLRPVTRTPERDSAPDWGGRR